jgi:hypothetical protein
VKVAPTCSGGYMDGDGGPASAVPGSTTSNPCGLHHQPFASVTPQKHERGETRTPRVRSSINSSVGAPLPVSVFSAAPKAARAWARPQALREPILI